MTDLTQARPLRPDAEAGLATGGAGWRGLAWLTFRQHRWLIGGSVVASAALTGWLLLSISRVHELIAQCGGSVCADSSVQAAELLAHAPGVGSTINIQTTFVLFMPLLFGALWGAPLVAREHEQRTAALAWSQDVSPVRWLFAKLALLGVLVAVLATPPTLAVAHIANDIHRAAGPSLFNDTYFQLTAGLPVVLSLAWFTLGVAVGALWRRTTVAFGVVVGLFVVRFIVLHEYRPRYLPPLTTVQSLDDRVRHGIPANSLYLRGDGFDSRSVFVDAAGNHHGGMQVLTQLCPPEALPSVAGRPGPLGGSVRVMAEPDDLVACLKGHGLTGTLVEYQPGSRLGLFHLIEGGTSLVVAALCVLVAWWAVRRAKIV